MLLQRVLHTIEKHDMLRPGDRVGVAVSGGADSVCLAAVLRALAPRLRLVLHFLHLNHGLRGAESDGDAAFVCALAEEWGLPCTVERANLDGGNLEQEARRARLRFFQDAQQRFGLRRVATGHTESDQAETVLYRAVRGAGTAGLSGILPVTAEGLIRPLLEVDRALVRQWLTGQGIRWREDSSNIDERFRRNVLRARVLPVLEERVRPGAGRALARLAEIAREEEDYWQAAVAEAWPGVVEDGEGLVFNTVRFRKLHPALARRVLREGLRRVAGSLRGFTQQHVERLVRLATQGRGHGQVVLPGVFAQRSMEWLRLVAGVPEAAAAWSVEAAGPGPVAGLGLTLEVIDDPAGCGVPTDGADCLYNEGRHWLDLDRLAFPLVVRNMRAGDTYQPVGDDEPRKVADLFETGRVPSWNRRNWPMILSAGVIVWSREFGAAAWAAAGPGTHRVLRVGEAGVRRGEK